MLSRHHLTPVTLAAIISIIIVVPVAAAHINMQDDTVNVETSMEYATLLKQIASITTAPGTSGTDTQSTGQSEQPAEERAEDTGFNPSLPPAGDERLSVVPFEHVPVTRAQRKEHDIEVYRLAGSNKVRFEVHMGEQPTTGYTAQVGSITREDDHLTVNVIFKQPDPNIPVKPVPTYPADAVEFELPDGTYNIRVTTMAFKHDVADISLE